MGKMSKMSKMMTTLFVNMFSTPSAQMPQMRQLLCSRSSKWMAGNELMATSLNRATSTGTKSAVIQSSTDAASTSRTNGTNTSRIPPIVITSSSDGFSHDNVSDSGRDIVLVSGGVESSSLLHQVHHNNRNRQSKNKTSMATAAFDIKSPLALFFDYGQRGADRERRAVNAQCDALGIARALEIDLRELGTTMRARQGSERRHVPLHHRNAVLLSIAASVAAQEQGTDIWIALCKDDISWYPSASEPFVDAMRHTLFTLDNRFRLHTPFIDMTKSEVVDTGLKHGVDFATTWSCMLGYERHCGRCAQCKARKQAFRKCKVAEPPVFYHH